MLKFIMLIGAAGMLVACGGTTIPLEVSGDSLPLVGTSGTSTDASTSDQDQSFETILNIVRIGNGVDAVRYDSRLDAAAQAHADDMVANGYFSHTSQNGDEVYDRITAQSYSSIAYGENIAGGQQSEQAALTAWENSPEHDQLMNADSFEDFGLGAAGSGSETRWVLVMATES